VRQVQILEAAAREAEAAAAWYERERPGLGSEFADAVETGIDLIAEDILPLSPMPAESGGKGATRLILRRFPYDIVVMEREAKTIVIAVAHHARKPGYWKKRICP
jgi:hypothetical protein